jgi:hypothetical protein
MLTMPTGMLPEYRNMCTLLITFDEVVHFLLSLVFAIEPHHMAVGPGGVGSLLIVRCGNIEESQDED